MTRFNDILNGIKEAVDAAQKTYKGKKRSDLKDSDFLFPATRSFPIVSPSDIPDAISNFGRMKGEMTYDAFLKKLYNFAKKKGPAFIAAFPKASKDKLGIKTGKASCDMSEDYEEDDDEEEDDPMEMEIERIEKEIELEVLKQKLAEIKKSKGEDFTKVDDMEEESVMMEMMEYKNDFYQMSIGSLNAVMNHAKNILENLENPNVKENLTASHLQGMIAVVEDQMRSIHDFVMFVSEGADNSDAASKPGLWENIRKKRERMGKKYRPAKPGDKDRPDPKQWKKLTKTQGEYEYRCPKCGLQMEYDRQRSGYKCPNDGTTMQRVDN